MELKDRIKEALEKTIQDRKRIFEAAEEQGKRVMSAKSAVQDAEMQLAGEEAQYRVLQDNLRELNANIAALENLIS